MCDCRLLQRGSRSIIVSQQTENRGLSLSILISNRARLALFPTGGGGIKLTGFALEAHSTVLPSIDCSQQSSFVDCLLAFCSHVILYFAMPCRKCGNVLIKHCIHSQMDLRPFTCLGLSRIREFLNGLASKKRLFTCISRSYVENGHTFRLKFYPWLWPFDNRLSRRTYKILLQMLSKTVLQYDVQRNSFFPSRNSLAVNACFQAHD